MTDDLAAEGDRLHACRSDFWAWAYNNWPAIRDEWEALRVRAETLQADLAAANQDLADLWAWVDYEGTRSKESLRRAHRPRLAAHAAAVEARP